MASIASEVFCFQCFLLLSALLALLLASVGREAELCADALALQVCAGICQ